MVQKVFLWLTLSCALSIAQSPGPPDEQEDQDEKTEEAGEDQLTRDRKWHANLPGGNYIVDLKSITAISKHSYVLDGGLLVSEVTIDTLGRSLARFYYLEPITSQTKFDPLVRLEESAKNMRKQVSERTGIKADQMAQKTYPTTTHAHTVEYRLQNETELDALYQSVSSAWSQSKGRIFSVK